ncbi:MAG: substrate-binding domain-containing protein [Bacteroidota bacterium]
MKTKIFTVAILVAMLFNGCSNNKTASSEGEMKGTITISGAFALYPLATKWGEEFTKKYPNVRFDISAGGAGKGMADALSNMVDIGMVSREINEEEIKKGAWFIPVSKDAVVPMINEKNPLCKELLSKGVSKETFAKIFITEEIKNWGAVIGKADKNSMKVYTRSDACGAADVWAKYMGKKQEDLKGTGVFGDPGLAEAVRNDVLGIGFNNICYAYDMKTGTVNSGLRILPLDINGDGKITEDENFYQTKNDLVKAIYANKFPSPPSRDLYLVCNGKPQDKKLVMAFLNWVLTEGQTFVESSGYIKITEEKLKQAIEKAK